MNALETDLRLLWLRRTHARHDRWTALQVRQHQDRALGRLRSFAMARSRWYARAHRGLADAPLEALPILTKAEVIAARDEIVTDDRLRGADLQRWLDEHPDEPFLDRYWLVATSGSSGRPGVWAFNRAEWAGVLASFARATDWAGLGAALWRRRRIATVGTTRAWHMSVRAARTLPQRWVPSRRFDVAEPLAEIVGRLNAWQPDLLVTYPSILNLLVDEQAARRLRIAPAAIVTGAEVLTAGTRGRVEATWGRRLFDQYAATETGGIASECREHAGLHLYEDELIVESVDEAGRPVAPGEFGRRLLVTVLSSRTVPLIRYELTDSVRLAAEPCPCGRPYRVVERVQGRSEEMLSLPARAGGSVAVHPVVIHGVMDGLRASAWQVVNRPDGLTVRLVGADEVAAARVASDLREALARAGAAVLDVEVVRVDAIARGRSGKAALITTSDR